MTIIRNRDTKEDFMRALGLIQGQRESDRLYQAMRDETIAVYQEFKKSDLVEPQRSDPNVQPPFYWHHIQQERLRWAGLEIWRRSGTATRPLFERGWCDSEDGSNWVISWLLYSVFRSRDYRNKSNGRGAVNNGPMQHSPFASPSVVGAGGTSAPSRTGTSGTFYDPVRE